MTSKTFSLLLRHRQLDDTIRTEQRMRWPDVARIQRLKKIKLALKDRMFRMATRQGQTRTA
jgi:uncharacterized protein